MAANPSFPGFDGLLALSSREGIDIRPTLLRVLTDLYVQTPSHSDEEEQHYVALASRLIEEVDDATRAMVRARLTLYPRTPAALVRQLAIAPAATPPAPEPADSAAAQTSNHDDDGEAAAKPATPAAMPPAHATELSEMFWGADRAQRRMILHRLAAAPLPRGAHIQVRRPGRAIETLDQAAFIGDAQTFALELGNVLMLPTRLVLRIIDDPGGEPLACAAKALGLPQAVYDRVLLFLDAGRGTSVAEVYRLSRLYAMLTPHAAQVLIAALRGAALAAVRAKYVPHLYDDERGHRRAAASSGRAAPMPAAARRRAFSSEAETGSR